MKKDKICIIGLGYVGLPLAISFDKKYDVVGYDIDGNRIEELKSNIDKSNEISKRKLINCSILFTNLKSDIYDSNIYIITVPTPVTKKNLPDLKILKKTTKLVANYLKKGDLVIFESTVYPGCIEEVCVPILSKTSKLTYNLDFYCGYSPERINPGDKKHTIEKVIKIVSGSNKKALKKVNIIYSQIIKAGTFQVKDIMTAESAKIIENIQRDVNIALINEFTQIFDKMNLNIYDILKAANTKWNFLDFKPGLVGGHCISVDPFYLTYKAKKIGYNPKMILAGRSINNDMSDFVVNKFLNLLNKKNIKVKKSNILILGAAFKENCPDFRNNQSVLIFKKLKQENSNVDIFDPIIDFKKFKKIYNIDLISKLQKNYYDGILVLVSHDCFLTYGKNKFYQLMRKNNVFFDFKNMFV